MRDMGKRSPALSWAALSALAVALGLAGCAGQRPATPVATPVPAEQEPDRGQGQAPSSESGDRSAVQVLVAQAREAGEQGHLGRAEASVERALRIAPKDPELWHRLARIRLQQARPHQAEVIARKSNGLAPQRRDLQRRNWRLIARARHMRGDGAGAQAAKEQVNALGGP